MAQEQRDHKNATTVQALFRGGRGRLTAIKFKENLLEKRREREERKRLEELECLAKARADEELRRAKLAREELERMSSVTLQKLVRGKKQKRIFARVSAAVLRMQRAAVAFLRSKRMKHAAKKVHAAARSGDLDSLIWCLKNSLGSVLESELSGVRDRECKQSTLLHSAAIGGSVSTLQFLLDTEQGKLLQNCPLANCLDSDGNTPLHVACFNGKVDAAIFLVRAVCPTMFPKKRTRSVSTIKKDVEARRQYHKSLKRGENVAFEGVGLGQMAKMIGRKDAILQGYLNKRKARKQFRRRFVVLTKGELGYFKDAGDAVPLSVIKLEGAMLKKSEKYQHTFELHSPKMLSLRNPEGRMYFQTSSQADLQLWISKLRELGCVRFAGSQLWTPSKLRLTIWALVQKFVSVKNNIGRTALHCLADPSAVVDDMDAAHLALWLVGMGIPEGSVDKNGMSALELAMTFSTPKEEEKVKDRSKMRRKSGAKARPQLCSALRGLRTRSRFASEASAANASLTRAPAASTAFVASNRRGSVDTENHFLSLYLDKLGIEGAGVIDQPRVTISVVSGKKRRLIGGDSMDSANLAEAIHSATLLLMPKATDTFLKWGFMWHMATPIEQLGKDSVVVIELSSFKKKRFQTVAWTSLKCTDVLNRHIRSGNKESEAFGMFRPPVDPYSKKKQRKEAFVIVDVHFSNTLAVNRN